MPIRVLPTSLVPPLPRHALPPRRTVRIRQIRIPILFLPSQMDGRLGSPRFRAILGGDPYWVASRLPGELDGHPHPDPTGPLASSPSTAPS